jgi:hypothetical protein
MDETKNTEANPTLYDLSDLSQVNSTINPPEVFDLSEWADNFDGGESSSNSFTGLERLSISTEPTEIMLLTKSYHKTDVYYLDEIGYLRFNDESNKNNNCILADINFESTLTAFMPVYHLLERKIKVITMNMQRKQRVGSLLPEIANYLKEDDYTSFFLVISRTYRYNYQVTYKNMPPNSLSQADIDLVKTFNDQFSDGRIDLRAIYQCYSNAELEKIDPVKRRLNLYQTPGTETNT